MEETKLDCLGLLQTVWRVEPLVGNNAELKNAYNYLLAACENVALDQGLTKEGILAERLKFLRAEDPEKFHRLLLVFGKDCGYCDGHVPSVPRDVAERLLAQFSQPERMD